MALGDALNIQYANNQGGMHVRNRSRCYVVESSNPKVKGLDGAVASFVEYLYALA